MVTATGNLFPTVLFAETVLQIEMVTATGNLFPTVLFAEAVLQIEMVTATGNLSQLFSLLKLFYR